MTISAIRVKYWRGARTRNRGFVRGKSGKTMNKLVVLKLDGDFQEGFRVSLEIGEDGSFPDVELNDNALKLPPLPTLPDISRWALKNTTRLRNVNRLKAYIQSVSGALHKFT